MKKLFFINLLVLIAFNSAVSISYSQTPEEEVIPEGKVVKAIEVEGNKTISIATVLSKIKTRVGQNYMQSVISDDLKRLYNTGYFNDVRVDRQDQDGGFKVVIYLEEKALVEEITFSKTRMIKQKALKKKLKTQVGRFLDNKDLKDDVDTINDLYTQKGLSNVDVEVEKFVDEVTNKATIHFVVKEGQKIRVKRINVLGNSAFTDKKVVAAIKTRPRWFIFRSGYLKDEVLEEDMDRLASFYEQNGYIDAKIDYTLEQLAKGYINVNITVEEGRRYWVGDITMQGHDVISQLEILKVMESIQEGGIFSRDKLSLDLSNVRTLYFDRGYIFAKVTETTSLDSDTGKVQVKIDIVEGDVAYIEQVKIQGNTRTKDIVIRRELRLYPGDRFDGEKLKKSRQRLQDLGYFEDVGFDIEDTETYDRKNLLVQIKEAKTGTFSFGGGFSTVDKLVGFIEIEQRNFDIKNWPNFTGGGQHLVFRGETGSSRNNLRLSFTEPWLFDRPISGGFDLFRSTREREEDSGYAYDEERMGANFRLGKRFSDIVSADLSYKIEEVTIENFESGVSADLLAEGGENTVSVLGYSMTRDTRDSYINPTKGYVLNGGADLAGGFLGGDKDFYRLQGTGSYYVPLRFKSVLELRTRAGIVADYGDSSKVPIFERFFAGGARSIRGYEERRVGPLDASTNDPIGGEALLIANIEYLIPLIDFVKVAAFLDTGNVWAEAEDFASGEFKSGTGVGLRVKTPIGPISLDYGYPLNEPPGEEDKQGQFYFSVSRGF